MNKNYDIAVERINNAQQIKSRLLDLSDLHLQNLPEKIVQLKYLETLLLSRNQLTDLPASLGRLANLKVLKADHNAIAQLGKGMKQFGRLEELDLSFNKLYTLPRETGSLNNLHHLNLEGNRFTTLPRAIRHLKGLETLNLKNNEINNLNDSIRLLSNLKELNLDNNQLTKIPAALTQLSKLQKLSINHNRLNSLQSSIGQILSLESLSVSDNQIAFLPEEIAQLKRLKQLDISHNQITSLPDSVSNLQRLLPNENGLTGLNIRGNRINIPEEMYSRRPKEIFRYVLDLQASRKNQPLHEAKLIFIGSGFVGKTSLINKLTEGTYNPQEEMTEGIVIRDMVMQRGNNDLKIHVWDFGGQEIMHATHKFFMTSRTAYVLVINPRTEDQYGDTELEYWLKLIRSYAGERVPVVIAINKCDTHKVDIPKGHIRDKYPNIVDFVETSCKENTGIGHLKKAIKKAVFELRHIDELLPESYFKIKEILEERNDDHIPYTEYENICREVSPDFTEESMETLVGLLHDLGIMLNYNTDRRLRETQVLNPEWVTKGVYQIITSPTLLKRKGILNARDINRILDADLYPGAKEKSYIMDIMERFELCYPMPEERETFLVPGAFPKDRPKRINWNYRSDSVLRFQYHYDVLPSSIISRFIVKLNNYIRNRDYWRNGLIIQKDGCEAFITADPEERKIFIEIGGKGNKRDLLALIRGQFEMLHDKIKKVNVSSKIPVDPKGEIVVDYEELLFCEEIEQDTYPVRALGKVISVLEVLNGIETAGNREKHRQDAKQKSEKASETAAEEEKIRQAQSLLPNGEATSV